jgi:hypothetical protein
MISITKIEKKTRGYRKEYLRISELEEGCWGKQEKNNIGKYGRNLECKH